MLTRRKLFKSAAAGAPALMLGSQALSGVASGKSPAAGKNVIIFITDQDRKVMHFPPGWEQNNLPGLTRLKKNGVSFENAFCNSCMCSPSRATMLTGLYPAQHGVKYTLEEHMPEEEYPQVELSTEFKNVATVMHSAGYEVVFKGKWHLTKPIGEDWSPDDLTRFGFERWNPPDGGANQDISEAGGGVTDHDGRFMDADGNAEDGEEGVLKFINDRASASKPWCMIVSLVNPHDVLMYPGPRNMDPPKYFQAGYDDSWLEGDIKLPPTVDEDLSTKPDCQAQFVRLFAFAGATNTPEKKRKYLNFYANLMKVVDGYLVEVLDALEATGQLDDTIVIRTADHGEMGECHGGMRQKNFNAYEETLRVPMVFSNPKLFPKSRKSNQLVSHVDLLPTLAGLFDAPRSARNPKWAGVDYSRHVLGKAKKATQGRVIFTFDDWQAGQAQGPYIPAPNHIVTVRERRWKLSKYYDAEGGEKNQWELYDLKKDPLERKNLAHRPNRMNPFQRKHFRRLRKRLKRIEQRKLQPLPSKDFAVRSVRADGASVISKLRLPGRGTVDQRVFAEINGKRRRVGKLRRRFHRSGRVRLELKLSDAMRRELRKSGAELRVVTRFRPDGGLRRKVVRKIRARKKA